MRTLLSKLSRMPKSILAAVYGLLDEPLSQIKQNRRLFLAIGSGLGVVFLAGFGTLALVFASGGVASISSNSDLCATCHQIKPPYEEWRVSSHKGVNCLNCHTTSGLDGYFKMTAVGGQRIVSQLTGSYEIPVQANVDNESCLRCHPKSTLAEELPEATLRIAHSSHDELNCATCHSRVVHVRQLSLTVPTGLASHADKNCTSCHSGPEPAYLHGNSGVACSSCHSATIPNHEVAKMQGAYPMESCLECHVRQRVRADCQTCHTAPHGFTSNFQTDCSKCHSSTETWREVKFTHPVDLSSVATRAKCTSCHKQGVNISW